LAHPRHNRAHREGVSVARRGSDRPAARIGRPPRLVARRECRESGLSEDARSWIWMMSARRGRPASTRPRGQLNSRFALNGAGAVYFVSVLGAGQLGDHGLAEPSLSGRQGSVAFTSKRVSAGQNSWPCCDPSAQT